jgi:hypothetical protein
MTPTERTRRIAYLRAWLPTHVYDGTRMGGEAIMWHREELARLEREEAEAKRT